MSRVNLRVIELSVVLQPMTEPEHTSYIEIEVKKSLILRYVCASEKTLILVRYIT